MKNKGLIAVVILLFVYLVASFGYGMGAKNKQETAQTEQENPTNVAKKTVGILQFVSHQALDEITEGIKEGLKQAGYTEEENLTIVFQNGQGDQSKLATMSQQLVQQKPDVLIGVATPAAQALANTTQDIPIVLGAVTDPIGAGLLTDLENPGGNITGVSNKTPVEAQIKLAQELLPEAKSFGILYASSEDNSKSQVEEALAAAESFGLTAQPYAVPSTNEIAQTVQVMAQSVDFIYIPLDNTMASAMQTVVNEANKTKTPIIAPDQSMVEQGGLATIGQNQFDIGVKTGEMAAAILSGKATPATTPVYIFKEGTTILNQEQADFLGIELPASLKEEAIIVTPNE